MWPALPHPRCVVRVGAATGFSPSPRGKSPAFGSGSRIRTLRIEPASHRPARRRQGIQSQHATESIICLRLHESSIIYLKMAASTAAKYAVSARHPRGTSVGAERRSRFSGPPIRRLFLGSQHVGYLVEQRAPGSSCEAPTQGARTNDDCRVTCGTLGDQGSVSSTVETFGMSNVGRRRGSGTCFTPR